MKALVMTAQDAREFEKLGGLTITKAHSQHHLSFFRSGMDMNGKAATLLFQHGGSVGFRWRHGRLRLPAA